MSLIKKIILFFGIFFIIEINQIPAHEIKKTVNLKIGKQ